MCTKNQQKTNKIPRIQLKCVQQGARTPAFLFGLKNTFLVFSSLRNYVENKMARILIWKSYGTILLTKLTIFSVFCF